MPIDDNIVEEKDVVSGEIEPDQGSSLRETLEQAYDEIEERGEDAPIEDDDRDDSGRFKKKDIPSSTPDETPESDTEAVTESQQAAPPVLAPAGWDADAKELFNRLPPRLQQQLVKRESDLRRRSDSEVEQIRHQQRTYAEIDQALAPRMKEFQLAGVTPGQMIGRMMAWQNHIDSNPVQGLADLARSYGLDLRQIAEAAPTQSDEPPYVRELRNQVQATQGYLQQLTTQQKQQADAQRVNAINAELLAFTQETDSQGNPVRPHLEHVVEDMIPYVQHLRSTTNMTPRQVLQAAYEKALWANPATRELEMKRGQINAPSPAKSLARAKQAQKLVNGEAKGLVAADVPDSLRGDLLAAWDKIHG